MKKADIGLIGLAVMGENLVMNMESKGFTVAVFNRTTSKVDAFVNGRAAGKNIIGCHSLEELVANLAKPRKVFMMVKAGSAVDSMIEQLLPLLEDGDILIDGGNSHFPDTIRRTEYVESKGKLYIGTGVSGGEEGALKGPSMMPGGSPAAWPYVKPIFQAICAKVEDGSPCCDWVGENGAGHFVKMVHNGIEYGDMQLICEAYQLMRDLLGLSYDEMHDIFTRWNETELDSYLIEITRDILGFKDEDGSPLVEHIRDTAGQKGTGKWTGIAALDEGVPLTLIGEAVFARCLSAMKEERVEAARVFDRKIPAFTGDKEAFIEAIRQALSPPRSSPTPRATPSCAPPPSTTAGTSTTAASPSCGGAAASSAASSSARSRKPTTRTPPSATCSSTPTSRRPSRSWCPHGAPWPPPRSAAACPLRP